MKIGVPKEILDSEYRVGLTPNSSASLVDEGHTVFIEKNAGLGSGYKDEDYKQTGAIVLDTAAEVFGQSEMIIKVKQPLAGDLKLLEKRHILFTYLHLAADRELAESLCKIGLTAYAYETIQLPNKALPALLPMSEIAGRMSIQIGAHFLEKAEGGSGVLLSGVPGVPRGKVVVLGGGVAGSQAARQAVGMGADVTLFEKHPLKIRELDQQFGKKATVLASELSLISEYVRDADLVVGAVLLPGRRPPVLVKEATIAKMRPGSVVLDIAIDQGGCIETIKPTKHSEPTFLKHGVVHYGVVNMPGAVPRTSTQALNNATLPYILELAESGANSQDLYGGLNIRGGDVTHPEVKEAVCS
ncbi:MAG: alanine dehydrogenase [Candidatus Caenarcaniphilales bacterium]|nr:alanine dehydrogenase [Candidatus Caenarcaniphilales bacterium]